MILFWHKCDNLILNDNITGNLTLFDCFAYLSVNRTNSIYISLAHIHTLPLFLSISFDFKSCHSVTPLRCCFHLPLNYRLRFTFSLNLFLFLSHSLFLFSCGKSLSKPFIYLFLRMNYLMKNSKRRTQSFLFHCWHKGLLKPD